ncbi:uncharacterized protein LOC136079798 [Hydra vulgaris]|uniref:Uncharacterized protein LOC136079798 n=1 Tax=Hydra vulgaris TaxID=6087 RepID=A0ABM4BT61_HYDVU
MMPPKKKIERVDDTFLVGKRNCTIPNNKFATTQEILQYYNFLRKSKPEVKLSFIVGCPNKSGSFSPNYPTSQLHCCIISKLVVPWTRGGFEVITTQKLRIKVTKMVKDWMKLKSLSKRNNAAEVKKRKNFKENMKKVFWIGENPLNMIEKIRKDRLRNQNDKEEDIAFLKDQLEERKGKLGGLDKRFQYSLKRKYKSKWSYNKLNNVSDTDSENSLSSFNTNKSNSSDSEFEIESYIDPTNSVNIPKDILHRTAHTAVGEGLTPHQHTAILSSIIVNSGGCMSEFVCSKSSSYRAAENAVVMGANEIRDHIKSISKSSNSLITIHFDGKIVKELTEGKQFSKDRLAVLARIKGQTELLGIPVIDSGSGEHQKEAIEELISNFGLEDKVQCLCFDTTSANTGKAKGACSRIIVHFQRPMLITACRHHIVERHVTHFWELYPSSHTSGPENKLFKLLKNHWNDLDTANQDLKRLSTPVDSWTNEQRLSAIQFCRYIISTKVFKKDGKFRKDYQELAELTLMVLSHTDRFKLHNPGAVHHARFISKSLFYLKLFLLMEKIPEINEDSKDEITEMTKFLSIFYTEWFLRAELSSTAPTQDMKAYWQMKRFEELNKAGAQAVSESIMRHTWYLDPYLVIIAIADQKCKERSNMAKRLFGLKQPSIEEYSLERQVLDKDILKNLNFSQDEPPSLVPLVTEKSWLIFDMLGHGKLRFNG